MNYIIYDIEATCWENHENRRSEMEVIEIGAVKFNENYETIGKINIIIKPEINPKLSKFCKELTHISQEEVDNGVSFAEGLTTFLDFCEENSRLGSWGAFDKNILEEECKRRNVIPEFIDRHFNLKYAFARKLNKKPMGLDKAMAHLNIEFTGDKHRALSDAINTAKIAKELQLFGGVKDEK